MDQADLETREIKYHSESARNIGVQRMERSGWKVDRLAFVPYKPVEMIANYLGTGSKNRIIEEGKVGYIKVFFSRDELVEARKSTEFIQRINDWFDRVPRWLSYGVLISAAALLMIWFSFTYNNEFWRFIGGVGFMAPALWIESIFYGLEGAGNHQTSVFFVEIALCWFLIGAAIGKIVNLPLFNNVSETSKLVISIVIVMGIVVIGFVSIFIAGGG